MKGLFSNRKLHFFGQNEVFVNCAGLKIGELSLEMRLGRSGGV